MNYYSNNGFNQNNNVRNYTYPSNYSSLNNYPSNSYYVDKNGDRIIGTGFLGPFVLGGITGGLVAPYFYRPYPNQVYQVPYPPRF